MLTIEYWDPENYKTYHHAKESGGVYRSNSTLDVETEEIAA